MSNPARGRNAAGVDDAADASGTAGAAGAADTFDAAGAADTFDAAHPEDGAEEAYYFHWDDGGGEKRVEHYFNGHMEHYLADIRHEGFRKYVTGETMRRCREVGFDGTFFDGSEIAGACVSS